MEKKFEIYELQKKCENNNIGNGINVCDSLNDIYNIIRYNCDKEKTFII